jgi:hypothetical protein
MPKIQEVWPPKPGTVAHALHVMAGGGKLARERRDPYPPRMMLRWTEGHSPKERELPQSVVVRMLTGQLIKPDVAALSKSADVIPYFLTKKGTQEATP